MLPLFSPAISVVVYIFGNTCWAANASDSNSPPLTRSRTFSSSCSRDLSRCRLIRRSSAVRIGSPALISVRNCWLKIRNVDCCSLPRLSPAPAEDGPGLDPVHQVSLLHEPVVDLGFGIAVLHLLPQMALFVGDFDQELCHSLSSDSACLVLSACCLASQAKCNILFPKRLPQ